MQFVVTTVKKICRGIWKGLNYFISGLGKIPDAGCFYCCKYFGKMSDGLGSIVGSCCKKPYMCCAYVTLIMIATPLIWGAIGLLDARKLDCRIPAQTGLLVSILCHAANFIFIFYLMSKYGKKKQMKKSNTGSEGQIENADRTVDLTQEPMRDQTIINTNRKRTISQNDISTEKKKISFDPETGVSAQIPENQLNKSVSIAAEEGGVYDSVLAKFSRKITKDKGIWTYILFTGFLIYWHVQCLLWIDELDPTNVCATEAIGKNMIGGLRLSILFMLVYLVLAWSVVGFTITIRACQEGSCNPWDINRACVIWITCGKVDTKNSSHTSTIHFETSKERFDENVREYSEGRAKWIEKSFNLLNNLGLGGRPYKVKHIEKKKETEDPHGISVDIRTFDQVNRNLNTTLAQMNQTQTQTEMLDTSPNMRKISGSRKPAAAQLGIPAIKPFNKI